MEEVPGVFASATQDLMGYCTSCSNDVKTLGHTSTFFSFVFPTLSCNLSDDVPLLYLMLPLSSALVQTWWRCMSTRRRLVEIPRNIPRGTSFVCDGLASSTITLLRHVHEDSPSPFSHGVRLFAQHWQRHRCDTLRRIWVDLETTAGSVNGDWFG